MFQTEVEEKIKKKTNFVSLIMIIYASYFICLNNYILSKSTVYVILARHKRFREDGVLTSKHVGANHM